MGGPDGAGSRAPLVAAGVAAAATGILLTGLWVLRGGGGTQPAPEAPATIDSLIARADSLAPSRVPRARAPVIGAFDSGVARRLLARAPSTRPLVGTLAITLGDVVWREPDGVEFARARRATGGLDLRTLRNGDILLRDVTVDRPVVTLREEAGRWNYEVVLADLLDGEEVRGGGERLARLQGVTVADGTVDVSTPVRTFSLEDLDGQLRRVDFTGPGLPEPRVEVAWGTAILVQPVEDRRLALRVEDGTARILEEAVAFDVARMTVEGAALADVHGVWSAQLPVYGVEAEGRAVLVRLEAMSQFFRDREPPAGTASFYWSVEPLAADAIRVGITDLEFESLGSGVAGSLALRVDTGSIALREADLRVDPLTTALLGAFVDSIPYEGTLTGTVRGTGGALSFDLSASLTTAGVPEPFAARVAGTVATGAGGFTLRGVTAQLDAIPLAALRAFVPSLPFAGTLSGAIVLTAAPDAAPMDVDVRLNVAAGAVVLSGVLDLTGAVPSYDLRGRLEEVDLQRLLLPAAPPVSLSAEFTLAGRGRTGADAEATLRLRGRFAGWHAASGDTLAVVARIERGVATVDTLAARLATFSLAADGQWRFLEPLSGLVRYSADITSLAPWGPFIPLVGDSVAGGSLALAGTLAGSLDRPQLDGELRGAHLRSGEWAARSIEGRYAVRWAPDVPEGEVTLAVEDLETPTAGRFPTVALDVTLARPDFSLTLAAERESGGVVEVEATGHVPPTGPRDLVLRRARADLAGGRWALVAPAAFQWGEDGLLVEGLDAREDGGGGVLRVDGRLLPFERADFQMEAAELPVADLQALLGRRPVVVGQLWTVANVRGGGGAPTGSIQFRLDDGAIAGVTLGRMEGTLEYATNLLRVRALAALNAEGAFDLQLDLPAIIDLAGARRFALVDSGAVAGSLTATAVSITPLEPLLPQLHDLTGRLDGRVALAGTVAEPAFDGRLVLTGGAVRVPVLGQTYSDIGGQMVLEGRRLTIPSVQVSSDGPLTLTGTLTFEDLTSPVADLAIELARFRPADVRGLEDAAVFGEIAVTGPLDALVMTGGLRIEDGYIPIPEFGPRPGDMFADLPELGQPAAGPGQGAIVAGLTIRDLTVDVGTDVWFSAEAARAQLGGQLTVNKSGETYILQGTLTGQRGTYTLQAGPIIRRFDILAAEIRFLGTPEPNPALDITARRIVYDPGGRQIEVEVRIGGTLRTPTLNLASADAPAFPESELLSVLFFGRPTLEVGGAAGESILEGTFLELATLELEELLIQDLGFAVDLFQVRFGPGGLGGFGSPTFVLGWELGSDVFLTAESGVAALLDNEANSLNTWALRIEWAFDRRSRLRASYEPVTPSRFVRGLGVALPITRRQQFAIELRRRWMY